MLYQVFQLGNRIFQFIYLLSSKKKQNYEVTTIIANCLLLAATVTLVYVCCEGKLIVSL